ncbi:MAG: zinc ribbon domain-containing protein [Anaerolineae bacterium]|nr:zinc ribbon domain-containing protein [Anaerolineae bacterium]
MAETPESTGRKEAGTYQMLWDCKFCGTEKLLGITHRHCPNCGAAQDPTQRYFPAEEDMVALEDHQYVGADKICPACQQPNSAASTYCTECGADLATGEAAPTFGARDLGTGIADSDTRRDVVQDNFNAEMARIGVTKADDHPVFLGLRKQQLVIGGVIAAVIVIIGAIIFAVTYRSEKSGTISALTWERTIDIEEFQQIRGEDWDESVPGDAYNEDCREKQRGTKQIEDGPPHEECKDVDQGDGSFKRECRMVQDYRSATEVDDWCTYTVDRWLKTREVTASGTTKNDPPPTWPDYTLATGTSVKRFGQERAGSQHESYRVVLDLDGDTKTCSFDQAQWETFVAGSKIEVGVGISGGPDCDTLKVVGSAPALPGRE